MNLGILQPMDFLQTPMVDNKTSKKNNCFHSNQSKVIISYFSGIVISAVLYLIEVLLF
jgi:hypothetical protein